MADAQLGVQTGYVGWSSVFLNRKAEYKPFATQGIYRYVRQPIYISFALVLWLSSTWTPDLLVLALAWTGYCIVGSTIKEKRFIHLQLTYTITKYFFFYNITYDMSN